MPKTMPVYTQQFKDEVLAYHSSSGESLKQTAGHFRVSTNSLLPSLPLRVPKLGSNALGAKTACCRCAARY
jgi:hypothetical protein